MAHLKNQVDPTGTHDLLESLSLIHCPYKVYAIAHQVWLVNYPCLTSFTISEKNILTQLKLVFGLTVVISGRVLSGVSGVSSRIKCAEEKEKWTLS